MLNFRQNEMRKGIQLRVNSDISYEYTSGHSIEIGSMDILRRDYIGIVVPILMLDWKKEIY